MKKSALFLGLVSIVVIAMFLGGTWTVSHAQGTVPPVQPTQKVEPAPTQIPVGSTADFVVEDPSKPIELPLTGVGGVTIPANSVSQGASVSITVVDAKTLTNVETIAPLTEFVEVKADVTGKFTVYFNLSQAEIDAFLKDPNAGILCWDAAKGEWVRIAATLKDGVLSVDVTGPGIYTVGSLVK